MFDVMFSSEMSHIHKVSVSYRKFFQSTCMSWVLRIVGVNSSVLIIKFIVYSSGVWDHRMLLEIGLLWKCLLWWMLAYSDRKNIINEPAAYSMLKADKSSKSSSVRPKGFN